MWKATAARLACLAVLMFGVARGARAGDERERADGLTLRLFDVAALVRGRVDFVGERVGVVEAHRDEDGRNYDLPTEADEAVQPLGTIEELIELLKTSVEPESWVEVDGADAKAMSGRNLVVLQRAPVHAAIGAAIRGWEAQHLRTFTVEVQVLKAGEEAAAQGKDAVAARVERSLAEPGVSLTALPDQRVAAFIGVRQAFVQSYDVTSEGEKTCADPAVGIANLGLGVDVRAFPSAVPDRVHLWIRARLARARGWERSADAAGREVSLPRLDEVSVEQNVEVRVGRWTLLDGAPRIAGAPGFTIAVRVAPDTRGAAPATSGLGLPGLAPGDPGAVATRQFVTSLMHAAPSGRKVDHDEALPAGSSPMHREFLDPLPPVSPDALEELVRQSLHGDRWPEDHVLMTRNSALTVRAPARVLTAVGKTIEVLERACLRSVAFEAEVLDVPADLPVAGDTLLDETEARALAAAVATEDAKQVDSLRVTSAQGANNGVAGGEVLTYVHDVDPLSTKACQGVPQRASLRDGATLEVAADPTAAGDAVFTTVRFVRTWVKRPLAVGETTLGKVDLPEVRTLRLRTSLVIPLDATAVVGSAVEDGRRTILLLTPRMRRAGD